MASLLAIGFGAGLASALLFAVVVTGSSLALVLSLVAPLPILIAALGWNHRAGLAATLAGAGAVTLAFKPAAGVAFALGWALPAWWLAYLALLGRPRQDGVLEWYPLGRLLLWIAATAAVITVIGMVALGGGDYETYRATMRKGFEGFLRVQASRPGGGTGPGGAPGAELFDAIIGAVPLFLASSFVTILTLNLWVAAKVVSISQRLPRPWPHIPNTAMPRTALALLGGAVVVGFLPGFVGALGLAVTGALLVAFALQGLAMLHEVSRGRPSRGALLAGTYILAIILGQIMLPALAVAGIADAAFDLRHRFPSGGAGPRPT
jgi:hypothetical protein